MTEAENEHEGKVQGGLCQVDHTTAEEAGRARPTDVGSQRKDLGGQGPDRKRQSENIREFAGEERKDKLQIKTIGGLLDQFARDAAEEIEKLEKRANETMVTK